MTLYRLTTLAPVAVTDASGRVADISAGKSLALLIYLALTGKALDRDEAGRLLWPALPRERARRSTRQALWLLRRELGAAVFGSGDVIALAPGAIDADANRLAELIRAGALDEADALWREPFLSTFTLPSVPAWEEWVEGERARLAELLAGALFADGVALRGRSELEAAERRLRRAVEIQPYLVERHAELIEVLLALGRPGDALEALGVTRRQVPDAEKALAGLEKRALDFVRARATATEGTGMPLEFVGRAVELSVLASLWRDARRRLPGRATISGPSGIGKSRLAVEACARARVDGRAVIVKAYEGEARLEHGFASTVTRRLLALSGAAGISAASEATLSPLVPSLSRARVGGAAAVPTSVVALADALADLISAVAYEAPLLLVFDDVHWADAASLLVLSRALRMLRDEPVLVLLTYRPMELGGSSAAIVQRLESEEDATVLRLRPLGAPDVHELISATVAADSPAELEALAERVFGATAGNPLFIVEALRALREDGIITRERDVWRLVPGRLPQRLKLPATVEAVLERRLRRLDSPAAAVVAALAWLPRPASRSRVRQASGLDEETFAAASRALVAAEIVGAIDGRLVFVHDRIREIAARLFPSKRWWRRGAALVGLAAVSAVVAGGAGLTHALRHGPTPPPYGGGTLYVISPDSVVAQRPTNGGWSTQRAAAPALPIVRARPFRTTGQELRWLGTVYAPSDPPYVVELLRGGGRRLIARSTGDTDIATLSPDGRWVAFLTENLATPQYDMDLVVARADGSAPRRIYSSAEKLGHAEWSPNGQMIATSVTSQVDTLVVLTPAGGRIVARPFRDVYALAWCGNDRVAVSVGTPAGNRVVLVQVADGSVTAVQGEETLPGMLACSPDGSALALRGLGTQRSARLIIRPLNGQPGSDTPLPASYLTLRWLPDSVAPVAQAVRILGAPGSLRWGERRPVRAAMQFSDGSARPTHAEWWSSSPHVAAVNDVNELTGNGPGRAWIRATVNGWLSDSVLVNVAGEVTEGVLLRERFTSLDSAAWAPFGLPAAYVTSALDGRPALLLAGDGRWLDGVVSRRALPLPRGATLEADVSLSLNRRHRQRVRVCLVRSDSTASPEEDALNPDLRVCFQYPQRELAKLDPRIGELAAGLVAVPVRVEPMSPGTWLHVALRVRADGLTSLYLDHRWAADAPARILMRPAQRWRVAVYGASVDTRVWVRDLVLWDVPRY